MSYAIRGGSGGEQSTMLFFLKNQRMEIPLKSYLLTQKNIFIKLIPKH